MRAQGIPPGKSNDYVYADVYVDVDVDVDV
jgi:hypothetical protein